MKYMMKKCLDPYSSYSFFWEMRSEVLAVCVLADFMPDIPYFETIQYCMEKEYGRKCAIYLGRHVEDLDQEQADTAGRDMLLHCKEFLDNHYMEEISLEQTAEKYYFNPSYFSSLFKNTFDMTFSEYLIRLRMGKAKQLKYYGVTPEEFRRQAIRQED